jgi:hypothetical protein
MNSHTPADATPIEKLTRSLTEDVRYLTGYLEGKGYSSPSFDRHTPTVVLGNDASQDAQFARERIMNHTLQLFQLVAGPSEYLATLQTGVRSPSELRLMDILTEVYNSTTILPRSNGYVTSKSLI